jgi:hypothetical protein
VSKKREREFDFVNSFDLNVTLRKISALNFGDGIAPE